MRRAGTFAHLIWVFALSVLVVAAVPTVAVAEPGSPGRLIAATPLPFGIRELAGGSMLTYWTSGAQGDPVRASGALFVPPGPAPAGGWPVVAYDHGTTGMAVGCFGGSYPGGDGSSVHSRRVADFFQEWVSKGYAVVAPDYVGLGLFDTGPHPYLGLRTEATATIDLLRAAREQAPRLSRTWAVVGESQGGQAALGTGHLAARYAPDLDFRGTVAVDPESDVEQALMVAGPYVPIVPGGPGATGYLAMILAALRAARPDLNVDGYLTPLGRTVLNRVGTLCQSDIEHYTTGMALGSLLSRPLSDDSFRKALSQYMTVPTAGYSAPILLLLNAADEEVPSPLHGALAAELAAHGVDFRAVVGTGQHVDLDTRMRTALTQFVDQRLAGAQP